MMMMMITMMKLRKYGSGYCYDFLIFYGDIDDDDDKYFVMMR